MSTSSESKKEYDLPTDKTTKIITVLGILGTLSPIALFTYFGILSEPVIPAISASILIVLVIAYLFSPKKIVLEDDRVVIGRVFGSVEIPYTKIREVTFLGKPGMLRLFGSGGFFGYFGLFSVEGDKTWVYARKMEDLILVRADKNYLIAPENAGEFIGELESKVKVREEMSFPRESKLQKKLSKSRCLLIVHNFRQSCKQQN